MAHGENSGDQQNQHSSTWTASMWSAESGPIYHNSVNSTPAQQPASNSTFVSSDLAVGALIHGWTPAPAATDYNDDDMQLPPGSPVLNNG